MDLEEREGADKPGDVETSEGQQLSAIGFEASADYVPEISVAVTL